MKIIFYALIGILLLNFAASGQVEKALKTVEFFSPMDANGKTLPEPWQSCFSFINENHDCSKTDLIYGMIRAGDDWDFFKSEGEGARNQIVLIGEYRWTDSFILPTVEPYPELKEGESRKVVIVVSGADGIQGERGRAGTPGTPGRNGDGDVVSSPVDEKKDLFLDKPSFPAVFQSEEYVPFVATILGNMYLMRVVDKQNDFHVLFRVEELERGKRCVISWKRLDLSRPAV